MNCFCLILQLNQIWVRFKQRFLKDRHYLFVKSIPFRNIVICVRLKSIRKIFKLSSGRKFFLLKFYIDVIDLDVEFFKIVLFTEDLRKVVLKHSKFLFMRKVADQDGNTVFEAVDFYLS